MGDNGNAPMQSSHPMRSICGAKTRGGEPCKSRAMANGRCRMHGGVSLSGMDVSSFKDGRYSKYLTNTKYGEVFDESRRNPQELLDLSETLAIFDAEVKLLAARVNELDTPDFRKRAKKLMREMKVQREEGDEVAAANSMTELYELLERGADEDHAVDRLMHAAERMSKRVEAAWSIKLNKQNAINTHDLLNIMGQIVGIVMEISPGDSGREVVKEIQKRVIKRLEEQVG